MKKEIRERIEAVHRGEVPVGYRIENGYLIPDDWKTVPLNSRFTRSTRKNKSGCENVLTISAQMGLVNQREFYDKDIASEDKSGYFLIKNGEFAYNKSYSTGYPYGAIKQLAKYDEGIVSPLYICFAPKAGTNTAFYTQYFEGGRYNREIYRIAQEGARNHGLLNIAVEDFFTGTLVEPSAGEQQKIAEILAACDRVIELKQQLLEEKCRQKKWLMQKLLDPDSGVHLPGFETRVWKEIPLSEVFSYIRNGFVGTATPYYVDDGIPYIEGTNIQNGQWDLSEVLHISEEFHRKHPNSVLRTGDVVVVQSGHVGDCTVVTEKIDGSNSHAIIIMTPTPRVNPYFCACYINSPVGQGRLVGCITGNTVKHILASDMKKYLLPCPEKDEQDALANLFCAAEKEITAIEKEIDAWKQKKKALMQLLLTGLVRV